MAHIQGQTTGTIEGRAQQPEVAAPRPLPAGEREPWPSFLKTMAWVGINTFGGPVAQIGVMHQMAVERRGWLTDAQFVHLLNFANVLPGPEALEIAIHLGYLRRGLLGGIAAGILFIWPGFVCLTGLAWIYARYGNVPAVSSFLDGIRPVAVALIAWAVVRLSARSLRGLAAYALMAGAFVAHFFLQVPFIALLLACGGVGLGLARVKIAPQLDRLQKPLTLMLLVAAMWSGWLSHATTGAREAAQTSPIVERSHGPGAQSGIARLASVAWVNTKAALLTFGGAYTVLPYLREQAVWRHRWVSDVEMVDALAFGETTPGPLISIGVFISYLAGGFSGAVVGCFFLFLPSFVLVLSLARHLERIENLPRAKDFLWGVSAGTLGLILSLSAHLMPEGIDDAFGTMLAVASFAALWRLESNVVLTVLCGGILGLARSQIV